MIRSRGPAFGRKPFNEVRGGPGSARIVDLYLREGCHLCAEARRVVLAVAADAGARVREHDIDADEQLRERYGELVPVVLVNGEPHAQWRVDPARLREALRPRVDVGLGRGRSGARGRADGRSGEPADGRAGERASGRSGEPADGRSDERASGGESPAQAEPPFAEE